MAITGQQIVDDVRDTLNDDAATRWSAADLVVYLNEAIRHIALVRPDALAKTSSVILAAGTRQTLPSDGLRFMKVNRNMGTNGSTPGVPVKRADLETLGLFKPDWHSQSQTAAVKNYLTDDRDPRTYWVEPPSDGTGYVEIVYSYSPTAFTTGTLSTNIPIDDFYEAPIKQWMWHRAFAKEISSATSQALSRSHERAFYQSLGIKYQGDRAASPNSPEPKGFPQ